MNIAQLNMVVGSLSRSIFSRGNLPTQDGFWSSLQKRGQFECSYAGCEVKGPRHMCVPHAGGTVEVIPADSVYVHQYIDRDMIAGISDLDFSDYVQHLLRSAAYDITSQIERLIWGVDETRNAMSVRKWCELGAVNGDNTWMVIDGRHGQGVAETAYNLVTESMVVTHKLYASYNLYNVLRLGQGTLSNRLAFTDVEVMPERHMKNSAALLGDVFRWHHIGPVIHIMPNANGDYVEMDESTNSFVIRICARGNLIPKEKRLICGPNVWIKNMVV